MLFWCFVVLGRVRCCLCFMRVCWVSGVLDWIRCRSFSHALSFLQADRIPTVAFTRSFPVGISTNLILFLSDLAGVHPRSAFNGFSPFTNFCRVAQTLCGLAQTFVRVAQTFVNDPEGSVRRRICTRSTSTQKNQFSSFALFSCLKIRILHSSTIRHPNDAFNNPRISHPPNHHVPSTTAKEDCLSKQTDCLMLTCRYHFIKNQGFSYGMEIMNSSIGCLLLDHCMMLQPPFY